MTTTTKNFLGIPVEGEINEGSKREKQRPIEELAPLMQAVIDDPTIVEFGWTQYTPYFNDGDPCVFGVRGDMWVRTTDDASSAGDGEDYDEDDTYLLEVATYSEHPSLGKRGSVYNSVTGKHDPQPYEGPDEARYDRCLALSVAVSCGEFDDVLLDAFGDHAAITVRRDGIKVDEYSHE